MVQVTLDGSAHTGNYRGDCECGAIWHGRGDAVGTTSWSPALPVAEATVHIKLLHPHSSLDLRFTTRFSTWLEQYWSLSNHRRAAANAQRRWNAP